LTISCGQTKDKAKNTNGPNPTAITTPVVDTSNYFIKRLLNASPKEVAKQLGEPDSIIKASNDCDYLPSCFEATYQMGKYNVLYYKNRLKWIEIDQPEFFHENVIQNIGFPNWKPTWSNPSATFSWRSNVTKGTATGPLIPIEGLREVSAFPNFIVITVEADYDKRF